MPITNRVTGRKPDLSKARPEHGPEQHGEADGEHDHGHDYQQTGDESYCEH